MKAMLEKAKSNKELALAIIGQAISDEADIGVVGIKISLVSKEEAKFLWEIADKWEWANKFKRFKDTEGLYDKWGFTIKSEKREEIYDGIGPIPNPEKDRAFKHLVKHQGIIKKTKHNVTKNKILQVLKAKGPIIARTLMYGVDISYSALKEHLNDLRKNDVVVVVGKNVNDIKHAHRRQANLWFLKEKNSSVSG